MLEDATVSKMEIVQQEGKRQVRRKVDYYSLDAIISVGYRVNSKRATSFRIWAITVLKEYMIKRNIWDLQYGNICLIKARELLEKRVDAAGRKV